MSQRMLLLLLLVVNVATAVALVISRHSHRQLFVELNRLEGQRDELNIEFGRLQLEQATWADTQRIERIAREQLGMKNPEPSDLAVLTP
jgi:cell division protein FtsL